MGRAKYTDAERKRVISGYIDAAREIIDEEGIENVSIRKVARKTRCNSATMYLYFKDLDELVTLSAISCLEDYCRALCASLPEHISSYDLYMRTWDFFCDYAFRNPRVYYQLFFSRHTRPLGELIEKYYAMFPEQIENADGSVRDMLLSGDLGDRNLKVLRLLADDGLLSEKDVNIVNDITVCYFRKFLEDACGPDGSDPAKLKADFLRGITYLLKEY